MSTVFVPEIVCVFMDTDFMRLLRKSWNRPHRSLLQEGFASLVLCKELQVLQPCSWGWTQGLRRRVAVGQG